MSRQQDVKNAIDFEFAAFGSDFGEEASASYIDFVDLKVDRDGEPVDIGKRAMAGVDSLARRSQLRFVIHCHKIIKTFGYKDLDLIYEVQTTLPEGCEREGREATLHFTCAIHVSGTGRIEPEGLRKEDFGACVLKVTGSDGQTTTFAGDLRRFKPAKEYLRALKERFIYELAFRQLVDEARQNI